MVKLSTLNKYKSRLVTVEFWDENEKQMFTAKGILDDVEQDAITVAERNGFSIVPIEEIRTLECATDKITAEWNEANDYTKPIFTLVKDCEDHLAIHIPEVGIEENIGFEPSDALKKQIIKELKEHNCYTQVKAIESCNNW